MRKAAFLALTMCAAAHAGGVGFFDKPKAEPKFLPVDQAFEIQPLEKKDGSLLVTWRIAPGYYLYRQRMSFEPIGAAKIGPVRLPAGEKHSDEYFGVVEIYRDAFLTAKLADPQPGRVKLKVSYQGCADAGLCYPPQERVLEYTP